MSCEEKQWLKKVTRNGPVKEGNLSRSLSDLKLSIVSGCLVKEIDRKLTG
jgi:hypothetical protein